MPSVMSSVACFTNTPKCQLHLATTGKWLPTLLVSLTYAAAPQITLIRTMTSRHPISSWSNLATVLQVADAHYGRHSGEHPKLRETRLHEFRLVSEKWHRFISHEGIRPAVAEQVGATASSGRRIGADVDIDTRPAQSDVDSDTRPARSDVDSDTRPAQSDVDSDIRLARSDIYSDSRSEAPVSYRASSTKIVKHVESHRSLQFLRQYFRDRNAVFKSPEQRAAVENVLFTTSDIIAVLPTGCGKSLIFFLYSFVFPNLTSVVVVPTVLLKQDLLRRAAEKGISSSDHPWGGEGGDDVSLLFLIPEAAAERSTRDALAQLYCSRRLGRIFIDEFHLFSLDSEYRSHFRELPLLTFLPVPFVFTSATAPDWITNDVVKNFFHGSTRIPKLVSQACNRSNIRYTIFGSASMDLLGKKLQCDLASLREEDRVIVYVPSLKLLEDVKAHFEGLGIPCTCYSGQLNAEINAQSFASWRDGYAKLMVATSVFGMGVDYCIALVCPTPWLNLPNRLAGPEGMDDQLMQS